MEKVILEPQYESDEVLVEFSKSVTLTKAVLVSVPNNYQALFAADENYLAKIDNCKNASLLKLVGREFKNKDVKVAFVRKVNLPLIPWGFGDVKVNNPKLNISYNVGCNGKYLLEITNPHKLIKAFGNNANITLNMLKDKTKPYIEPIARPVLASYFVNHELSIYEIEAHLDEIRKDVITSLMNEDIYKDLGLKLKTITINTVHVPEEELERVKKELNKLGLRNSNNEPINKVSPDDLASIKTDIKNIKKQLSEQDQDLVLEEIDNLRMEIITALNNLKGKDKDSLQKELDDLDQSIKDLKK